MIFILAVTMVAGCASKAPQDTGASNANGEEAKPVPAAKAITLNLNHFMSPMHPMHAHVLEPFAADVLEKTEGRVEIIIHPNNGLAAPGDTIDAVEAGIVDIGFTLPSYTPGRFLLSTILEFPFMFSSSLQANLTAKEMFPILQEHDYKNMKLLWFGGSDLGHLLLKTPVTTVDGLRGLKLRSPGPIYNDVIRALNAVEVSLPVSDLYDALDRGITDGTFMAPTALISFKLIEVVSDIVELDLYITPFVMVMNNNSWNKISETDQKVIEDLLAEFPEKVGNQYDHEIRTSVAAANEKGINFSKFSDSELAKFHEIVDPLIEGWIQDMEAKGLPGQETFDLVKRYKDQYQ